MSAHPAVVVTPYNPEWPALFASLRDRVAPALRGIAMAIEHVGSTSVAGLAAKPVIDIDVVVPDLACAIRASEALRTVGYTPLGDLGIPERFAFSAPTELPRHNLYVVLAGCLSLRNHLRLRDHLRSHPEDVEKYGAVKRELAERHPDDVSAYCTAKTAVLLGILARAGLPRDELRSIAVSNGADPDALGVA